MELYRYKAVDADGRLQRGQADAVNPIDLEMRLTRLGLDLVSYRPVKPGGLFAVRQGIKHSNLITFCFHMEQLLDAGVPMIDALTDLRDSLENRRLQEITSSTPTMPSSACSTVTCASPTRPPFICWSMWWKKNTATRPSPISTAPIGARYWSASSRGSSAARPTVMSCRRAARPRGGATTRCC
ncbi:MAG: hypothetical protein M3461_16290 [Pseudomonadota bacterium]|nr:hypothetical protein [Pseudomonadota bacterium]